MEKVDTEKQKHEKASKSCWPNRGKNLRIFQHEDLNS